MSESQFIGVIVGAISGHIYAVINPDQDAELDNPRWLLLKIFPADPSNVWVDPDPDAEVPTPRPPPPQEREPLMMMRVPRGDYMGAMSTAQLASLVEKLRSK